MITCRMHCLSSSYTEESQKWRNHLLEDKQLFGIYAIPHEYKLVHQCHEKLKKWMAELQKDACYGLIHSDINRVRHLH